MTKEQATREALELALEALKECRRDPRLKYEHPTYYKAITAIKEALAQPEHTSEYKRGYADAMNWKVQNHLEHLPTAQPAVTESHKQEPVMVIGENESMMCRTLPAGTKLYTTPPQRTWVGLTLEDKEEYVNQDFGGNRLDAMDWAEQRLKAKNTNNGG